MALAMAVGGRVKGSDDAGEKGGGGWRERGDGGVTIKLVNSL